MSSAEDFVDLIAERVAQRLIAHLEQRAPQPPPPQAAQPAYYTTKQAAKLLGMGSSTLELWRAKGKGPAFVKLPGAGGAVRYKLADLEAWLAAHARGRK